jgi:ferredoxin
VTRRRTPRQARGGAGVSLDLIADVLDASGLMSRGGFHPGPADGVPGDPGTAILVGNAGPDLWQAFGRARKDEPHPLNAWTRRVLEAAAQAMGANVVFPFDGPPYHPFQRWAEKAEPVHISPIGPLIHPEFGLWHAYRGALLFTEILDLPPREAHPSPCQGCAGKPCLSACPVGALEDGRYDVPACVAHISTPAGRPCMEGGCLARQACPVGRGHAYTPVQARFHMESFLAAQLSGDTP